METNHIYIDEVGWDLASRQFVDLEDRPINYMFKLYPWEWIITESFAEQLLTSTLSFFEPAWKMILSNKAILPLLWEMYPNHRNLLPSFFEPPNTEKTYVEKPFFSREGENVRTGTWFMKKGKRVIYQEYSRAAGLRRQLSCHRLMDHRGSCSGNRHTGRYDTDNEQSQPFYASPVQDR